ncbi:MAG: hypothetical protein JNK26_04150 [Candidatus Doudnabacteria bacterium]|nr:hypothetical protein [Candidatus Doudnabacteria bacterium]
MQIYRDLSDLHDLTNEQFSDIMEERVKYIFQIFDVLNVYPSSDKEKIFNLIMYLCTKFFGSLQVESNSETHREKIYSDAGYCVLTLLATRLEDALFVLDYEGAPPPEMADFMTADDLKFENEQYHLFQRNGIALAFQQGMETVDRWIQENLFAPNIQEVRGLAAWLHDLFKAFYGGES